MASTSWRVILRPNPVPSEPAINRTAVQSSAKARKRLPLGARAAATIPREVKAEHILDKREPCNQRDEYARATCPPRVSGRQRQGPRFRRAGSTPPCCISSRPHRVPIATARSSGHANSASQARRSRQCRRQRSVESGHSESGRDRSRGWASPSQSQSAGPGRLTYRDRVGRLWPGQGSHFADPMMLRRDQGLVKLCKKLTPG
jgi:hypothetical protein